MSRKWTHADIPDQSGKVVIITGATSGLGKEASRVLAEKGATVIMAIRNTEKGEKVAHEIRKEHSKAKLEIKELDLASLKSVEKFSKEFIEQYDQLHILINNAGVMMCPYSKTADGFEIQMGTNHLGHFALTRRLMAPLKHAEGSRVVSTSSLGHRMGDINFDDINWEKRKYNTAKAYGDSKLANLYFTYEASRKFSNDPSAPKMVAAHPGVTATDLGRHVKFAEIFNAIIAQSVQKGTLPTLRAATDPSVQSGEYFGPRSLFETRGHPKKVDSNELSKNTEKAQKLWEMSEKMTGVTF
ncbi:oxidoreductase [Fulvivirga sediminis]|uniref:SDR family NAD(P)-dependent oxidoreductase n=1 Tax=Fulvivirga sediminis TaxID=2803949 RepID=A0A937FAM3_9BACT|nr:oxidoreductase [Fulvivirga sediminis]MBL3658396.1 SDR family NAD(P)-dependent oxidoreductase [Fulvivirga sediminis]